MKNQLNFTNEMKEMMRGWKGKTMQAYIENSNDRVISVVRFLIDDKAYDMDNEYVSYKLLDGDNVEYTCFACREADINSPLLMRVIGGKSKDFKVDEKIANIYILRVDKMYLPWYNDF